MTLQASGAISLVNLATEFGGAVPHSLNEYYRNGAYVGSGAPNVPVSGGISLNQFYGGSASFTFNQTISSNVQDYRLYNALIAAGWNGTTPVNATITINSGIYVYETSVGSCAMILGNYVNAAWTTFPAGSIITIINYGYIIGNGGAGGRGCYYTYTPTAGGNGGHALWVTTPVTIYNYGTIAGGGGGGGGAGFSYRYISQTYYYRGGGGGGGGAGGIPGAGGSCAYGWIINGAYNSTTYGSGYTGAALTGGIGGLRDTIWVANHIYQPDAQPAGNGGNIGLGGSAGSNAAALWYAYSYNGAASGLAGYYASGNANITWAAIGTLIGQVN